MIFVVSKDEKVAKATRKLLVSNSEIDCPIVYTDADSFTETSKKYNGLENEKLILIFGCDELSNLAAKNNEVSIMGFTGFNLVLLIAGLAEAEYDTVEFKVRKLLPTIQKVLA